MSVGGREPATARRGMLGIRPVDRRPFVRYRAGLPGRFPRLEIPIHTALPSSPLRPALGGIHIGILLDLSLTPVPSTGHAPSPLGTPFGGLSFLLLPPSPMLQVLARQGVPRTAFTWLVGVFRGETLDLLGTAVRACSEHRDSKSGRGRAHQLRILAIDSVDSPECNRSDRNGTDRLPEPGLT